MNSLLEMLGIARGDAIGLGFLATVFLAVALAVYGASTLWSSGSSVRRRISGGTVAQRSSGRIESLSFLEEASRVPSAFSPIVRHFVPTDMAKISVLRRRLVCAGYYRPSAIGFYYAARVGLALLFIALFAIAAPVISTRIPDQIVPVLGPVSGWLP